MAMITQKGLIGPVVISVIISFGFTFAVILLMTMPLNFKDATGQSFLVLMGVLSQAFAQVTNYWLGSVHQAPPAPTP